MKNIILIIDDAQEDLDLFQAMLEAHGYEVAKASDGQEGLEKIKHDSPVIVISDVVMPRMNGYDLLKEIRRDRSIASTPILIVTARSKMSGTFLDVGADSFISKPINGEAFLSEVDKLVQRVRGSKLIDKKVVIFSKNEKTSSSMHQQLATLGCATTEFTEEEKIIAVVRETDPDLFLLPINISTKIPLTLLVRILCTWALTDKQQDPSVPPSRTKRKMEIVLYEEERNLEHPWISDGEENHHAAKEKKALIQQCYNNGALGWIGTYSAETFKSNIMPYLYR